MRGGAGWLVVRHDLRHRALALAGLALVVALGGGAAVGALLLADRTDRAWDEYVARERVADLVVNPSLSTRSIGRAITHAPGVVDARRSTLFFAGIVPTRLSARPFTIAEVSRADPWGQVLGSVDGRFTEVDRPAVTRGRLPTGRGEVFVAEGYRHKIEQLLRRPVAVGSRIPVAFLSPATTDPSLGADPDQIVEPIAVEHLRVSGFGRLADDVLPTGLYPNERLVVSADVARRYTCLDDIRADQSVEEAYATLLPLDCSRSYDYYALQLRDGGNGADGVRGAFARAATDLTDDIPPALREQAGYFYIPQDRADLDRAVARTARPTVVALLVFATVAALATLVVFALVLTRQLGRDEPTRNALRAIGATRGTRARLAATAPLLSVGVGAVGAVVVGAAVSPFGPIGSVRAVVPDPGLSTPVRVVLPAALALALVTAAVVVASTWLAARPERVAGGRQRLGFVARVTSLRRTGRPPLTEGVRTALSGRAGTGGVVPAGCALALLLVVGAAVFDANLAALSERPERYGWPWDAAVITGAGYGNTDLGVARMRLAAEPAVRTHGFYALDSSVRLDGRAVPAIIGFPGSPTPRLPVLRGRAATGPDEVVLGAATARELGVQLGDTVRVASDLAPFPRRARVRFVGVVSLPTLGAFGSGHTALGSGAYIHSGRRAPHDSVSLTVLTFRPGTDPGAAMRRLRIGVGWDTSGSPPIATTTPIRPPEVATASSLRAGPAVLGVVLALALLVGLTLVTALSVHDRRRELAILRSAGFANAEMRRTVLWQSVTVVAIGLAVGVPLGVVAGRAAWRAFADALGVAPTADVPVAAVLGPAVVLAVLVLLAAAIPAAIAVRVRPADELREA